MEQNHSLMIDAHFTQRELAVLRGAELPTQGPDVELVELVNLVAIFQQQHLWDATPGTRFKKNSQKWTVGVLAACIGFTLGEALGRGKPFDPENRDYMMTNLDFAQLGAGSLLEERETTQRGARTARVLEAAITGAGIRVKDPVALMIQVPLALKYSFIAMRGLGVNTATILPP